MCMHFSYLPKYGYNQIYGNIIMPWHKTVVFKPDADEPTSEPCTGTSVALCMGLLYIGSLDSVMSTKLTEVINMHFHPVEYLSISLFGICFYASLLPLPFPLQQ